MKLGLATGVLSSTPPPTPLFCLLRVDRVWNRDHAEQPRFPDDELPETSFEAASATVADGLLPRTWEVTVDGEQLVLTHGEQKLHGRETSNVFNERRFEITETPGGRFVMRGEDAELTLFGSGIPILSSERGKLIPR